MLLWAVRALLTVAIAVQIGYFMLGYRTTSPDFMWWFGVAATLVFSALMVFDGRTLAGVVRVGLGLVFLVAALDRIQSCTHLGKLMAACSQIMGALAPAGHVRAVLPAVSIAQTGKLIAGFELALAALLILGLGSRLAALLAAVFLLAYGSIAASTEGILTLLRDATAVLFAGALLLAMVDSSFLGMDGLRRRQTSGDPFLTAFDEMRERSLRAWPARTSSERPLARG